MLNRTKLSWDAENLLNTLTNDGQKAPALQSQTGLDKKALREAVRELRLAGYKVCSGNEGYWLWDGLDDSWNHTKMQIKSRMHSMLELYNAMNNIPLDGQIKMDI